MPPVPKQGQRRLSFRKLASLLKKHPAFNCAAGDRVSLHLATRNFFKGTTMKRYVRVAVAVAALTIGISMSAEAQTAHPQETIDGVMTELYASVTREPGKPFQWERLRAIMLPDGLMIPQARQRGGKLETMNVDQFIEWIDTGWKPIIGTDRDKGFFEKQINLVVNQYGDVASAFTTYEKGPYAPRGVQGRGINAVQLVRTAGRWYISSITWDEENTAGPLPAQYGGKQ